MRLKEEGMFTRLTPKRRQSKTRAGRTTSSETSSAQAAAFESDETFAWDLCSSPSHHLRWKNQHATISMIHFTQETTFSSPNLLSLILVNLCIYICFHVISQLKRRWHPWTSTHWYGGFGLIVACLLPWLEAAAGLVGSGDDSFRCRSSETRTLQMSNVVR